MSSQSCISRTGTACWPERAFAALLVWSCLAAVPCCLAEDRATALIAFARFDGFSRTVAGQETVLVSPELDAGFAWDQLIVSWNVATNVALAIEARGFLEGRPTRWYGLGRWSSDPSEAPRTSPDNQRDADGSVATDTLVLMSPARGAQVRLTVRGPGAGLKFLALSFTGTHAVAVPDVPDRAAWGRTNDVPIRSQTEYPEGVQSWCSPASTSMLLAFWARELGRPDLDIDVRRVAAGVHDPGWPGTGNWPFNMAFAGARPGLRACVARFDGLSGLEAWTKRGLPVAISVSYAMLKGAPRPEPGDGHLVVVCGFTPDGDAVIADPGVRRDRVRRVFPRSDVARAWATSRRTAYLTWPEDRSVPLDVR